MVDKTDFDEALEARALRETDDHKTIQSIVLGVLLLACTLTLAAFL